MAAPGGAFEMSVQVAEDPETVIQSVVAIMPSLPHDSGFSGGYSVSTAGANTVVFTRRYRPTWAIVIGILGLPLFLMGVAMFGIFKAETLTIGVMGLPTEGSSVHASGFATSEMASRLGAVLGAFDEAPDGA